MRKAPISISLVRLVVAAAILLTLIGLAFPYATGTSRIHLILGKSPDSVFGFELLAPRVAITVLLAVSILLCLRKASLKSSCVFLVIVLILVLYILASKPGIIMAVRRRFGSYDTEIGIGYLMLIAGSSVLFVATILKFFSIPPKFKNTDLLDENL